MQVIIRPTKAEASSLTARLIEKALRAKPSLTLGLATGRTMERLYARLVQLHREQDLDFSLCRTFNLDEYIGLPPTDENSYRYYMNQKLFDHVNIDPRNTHLPHGMCKDLGKECRRYERLIRENGGIDLQLLGIGRAGHIGFNEPLSALQSRTRDKTLTPTTIEENSTLFTHPERMPSRAITMGVGTILQCRRMLVLVTGETKAEVLAKAVEGPVTSMISASAIQLHPDCTVICDEEAAAGLEGAEYYRWIFRNEPEWEAYQRIETTEEA
jgi:glucosamine-6-phosphate deaminase